jgi:hypothetical protein
VRSARGSTAFWRNRIVKCFGRVPVDAAITGGDGEKKIEISRLVRSAS